VSGLPIKVRKKIILKKLTIPFKEHIKPLFITGLVCAIGGAGLLIGISLGFGTQQVVGDGLGILTAFFYAGYILSIKQL
jgi:drug/metabolite transporter (DMT)-like permease